MAVIEHIKGTPLRSTYEIQPPIGFGRHVKTRPAGDAHLLKLEAEKINWARDKLPVPPRAFTKKLPGISLLVSRTVSGKPSFEMINQMEPSKLVSSILKAANTLRSLSTDQFPFDPPKWTNHEGVERNLSKLTLSKDKHRNLHPDYSRLTVREIRDIVDQGPHSSGLVMSHGDWCMPNVLLGNDGQMTGIVDLGGLHAGDENLDPAIMSWTLRANMGTQWEDQYLDHYGLNSDDKAVSYNRLAYDLGLEHKDPWSWINSPELVTQRAQLTEGLSND